MSLAKQLVLLLTLPLSYPPAQAGVGMIFEMYSPLVAGIDNCTENTF